MAYNRVFSHSDVLRILRESEGRPRPDLGVTDAPKGHSLSLHTTARRDYFGRGSRTPPQRDSTFLVPPASMATLVQEALNSVPGQRALVKLNHPDYKSTTIESILIKKGVGFDIFTVHRPPEAQSYFDWLSSTNGDGFIVLMFVLVYKIPGSVKDDIHIQTAYPKDYARLQGEEIVRPT
jgi:hypothetical protein